MTSARQLHKTVLLVDKDQNAREELAQRLRLRSITVHTAATIREARVHLGLRQYDLILLATRAYPEAAIVFRHEIRKNDPTQRVGFLVGPPDYISFTLGENLLERPRPSDDWMEKLKGRLASPPVRNRDDV